MADSSGYTFRPEDNEVIAEPDTYACVSIETRERLTGLSPSLLSQTVTVAPNGETTTVTRAFEPGTDIIAETATTGSAAPSVLRTLHGRTVESSDASAVTRYTYDGFGRAVSQTALSASTGATLSQTTVTFDTFGNAVTNITTYGSLTAVTSTAYDIKGRAVSQTDAFGDTTFSEFDDQGLTVALHGATYPVRYEYDTAGRKTSMRTFRNEPGGAGVPPAYGGDLTRWLYDQATGLCTGKIYADGSTVSYTYTPDGKPRRTTWARDAWKENSYDALGQLSGTAYSDGTPAVTLARNMHGTVTNAADSAGLNYAYAVNARQLVTSETVISGASTNTLTRLYDERERPAGISLGDGYAQQYSYDNESRVSAVSNAHFAAQYAYEDGYQAGHTITLPNGGTLTRAVTRDPHRPHLITGVTNLFNGTVISSFAYTHDILGRVVSRNDDTFGYNARSELASAILHTNAYGYVTDPIGNRLVSSLNGAETSYTANQLNQYSQISVPSVSPWLNTPAHDADGNMLTCGAFSFTWDAENRNTSVLSNGITILANAYDHRHRRIRKDMPLSIHCYVWDGWNIIAEAVSNKVSGTAYTDYNTWGVDLSGTMQGAGGVGGLLAVTRVSASGTQTFLTCYDGNGNITEYADESGAVRAHYEYDAFGSITAQSGDLAGTFTHRFSTKPFDAETGLVIYQLRPYSPPLGRWANHDPIEERGGLNLYAFVGNDPVSRIDHLGLRTVKVSKCHGHLILGHMVENDPIAWDMPDDCAYGGVVGCWPENNNPANDNTRWPNVPRHNKRMFEGWLRYLFFGSSLTSFNFASDHYEDAEQEGVFVKAVKNALSQASITSITDKLCSSSCCCDEIVLTIQTTKGGWELQDGLRPNNLIPNMTITAKGKCQKGE